ncbi:MAG: glutamate racemase [Rickettsiales bacterium]|nr:glutamate racemase [Rickettsiales bacterium]
MKIGVFDSGLGGLVILSAICARLPQYDFAYFGDTANMPYGSRSSDIICGHCGRAMDYLFGEQNCVLAVIACNTASIAALRKLQKEYLPAKYPNRRILGVAIPTMEAVARMNLERVGLVGTASTIKSKAYEAELAKLSNTAVIGVPTPLIVPLVENDGDKYAAAIIADYLAKFDGSGIQGLILGCTHYPAYKNLFAKLAKVPIISQDDIIPDSLADYLQRHSDIESMLSKNGTRFCAVSDLNDGYMAQAARILGEKGHSFSPVQINL